MLTASADTVDEDLTKYFRLLDRKRDGLTSDDVDLHLVEERLRARVGAPPSRLRKNGGSYDAPARIE